MRPLAAASCAHQLSLDVVLLRDRLSRLLEEGDDVLLRERRARERPGLPRKALSPPSYTDCSVARTAKVSGSRGALMLRFLWRMRVPPSCGFSAFALRGAGKS